MGYDKDNIFARIIRREIPAEFIYESENLIAIRDIDPKAPVHVLILPKKGIEKLSAAGDDDREILGEMLLAARDLAKKFGASEGFRVVVNEGELGGQSVPHLHMHLLAGRDLGWPPG